LQYPVSASHANMIYIIVLFKISSVFGLNIVIVNCKTWLSLIKQNKTLIHSEQMWIMCCTTWQTFTVWKYLTKSLTIMYIKLKESVNEAGFTIMYFHGTQHKTHILLEQLHTVQKQKTLYVLLHCYFTCKWSEQNLH